MIHVIREVVKLCMFIVLWGMPLLLARLFDNSLYLWLFVVSVIGTVGLFSHYENLEHIDLFKDKTQDNE